jgi:integrase/recombinase XerC
MTSLPSLLHGFFYDSLLGQRGASPHTVRSYRDSWRLFLRFVASHHRQPVERLQLEDLSATEVLAFLDHTERERKDTIGTRNCRLAAIRAFFSFVAAREPLALAQASAVLGIPTKRGPRRALCYLEPAEVAAILAQPDQRSVEGQRDHTLLALLYNTGARIQEVLDLTPEAFRFDSPACVRLIGKGRKERMCPLWPETVTLLKALARRQQTEPADRIFISRRGTPFTASGFRYRLASYVAAARREAPSLSTKRVSPHTYRHTTAVHLVAAGVDITVIRSWLGHADLETTAHYAQANFETKRRALEQLHPPSSHMRPPVWRNASVLAWLDTL